MSTVNAGFENRPATASHLPDEDARRRLRKIRGIRDGISRFGVGTFGIGVIFALGLIFAYLFYETLPMLKPVKFEASHELTLVEPVGAGPAETVHLTLDRFATIGARYDERGTITFFDVENGAIRSQIEVPRPEGTVVTGFGRAESRRSLFVFGFSDGSVLPVKVEYQQSFRGGERIITPRLVYPLGDEPFVIDPDNDEPYQTLAVIEGRNGYVVAGGTASGVIDVALYSVSRNMFTGQVDLQRQEFRMPNIDVGVRQILVNESLRDLFAIDETGRLHHFSIVDRNNPRLVQIVDLVADGAQVTAAEFLVGSRSLIVGGSDGSVAQFFLVRNPETGRQEMTFIRDFKRHDAPVTFIEPEYTRKGFLTGAEDGTVQIHYATSSVTLAGLRVGDGAVNRIAIAPANDRALVTLYGDPRIYVFEISNPHPQTSLSGLWGKVWYEGRDAPEWIWQSSSADDAFESKFSLVPLTVGTLKAALFAMLLSTPLAILGAIYTAYFMAPKMRQVVKPSIELMEALPTVILGFLAGIWLAPFVENNLPILMSGLILFPLGVLLAGWGWSRLPRDWRDRIKPGWEALLLVPVILLIGWIVVVSSPWIEIALFGGSARQWLTDVGIPYDQRNALIVGMAMGFAVIPTIFSIAEDAVFNVPKHLTQGSLALGATPWQTVVGVVLLTASPGLFSAVMIGFGRAVGETMIVLMASGNSPIVNFNIFEGMRTLAANIAVELPETAVGGTHYRVLFLSALVLLVFTFVLNTAAEVVRQRLRKHYASL